MTDDALDCYSASSADLIQRSESVSSELLYRHVIDLLPAAPSRIADIGAGTGRDAAWMAGKGHQVTAVEPVDEFRHAGMALHGELPIEWRNDLLPDLVSLRGRVAFDVVLVNGVWQHLQDDDRRAAMASLAAVTRTGGMAIVSLRHGRGPANRPVYPVRAEDTIDMAVVEGFETVRVQQAESVQPVKRAASVTWTWLALRRA